MNLTPPRHQIATPPATLYCPKCLRPTRHHWRNRWTRPASKWEQGRRYAALVCEDCGRESRIEVTPCHRMEII